LRGSHSGVPVIEIGANLAMPLCAVCNKTVDELIQTRECQSWATVFVARCHGQQEVVTIPESVLGLGDSVEVGRAFGVPKLLEVRG
jgi:hypothetical protein